MFLVPPIEWISERVNQLSNLLEQNTTQSALVLREVLGPITLEAKYPDIGKPYYIAHSSLDALAIMNTPSKQKEWEKGSSVLRWWARSQYRRTFCQLPFQITIYDPSEQPNYQKIAEKALRLKELGLNCSSIARLLNVDHKSVSKAIEWIGQFDNK